MDIIRLENVQFLCKKLISSPNLLLPSSQIYIRWYCVLLINWWCGAPYLFGVVAVVVSPRLWWHIVSCYVMSTNTSLSIRLAGHGLSSDTFGQSHQSLQLYVPGGLSSLLSPLSSLLAPPSQHWTSLWTNICRSVQFPYLKNLSWLGLMLRHIVLSSAE